MDVKRFFIIENRSPKNCPGPACEFTEKEMKEIIEWTKTPITKTSLLNTSNNKFLKKSAQKEKEWGNRMIKQKDNNQWTTNLGESLVFRILKDKGKNPRRCERKNGYEPDIETDDAIYEVKTRNWSTPGTAGEKVYGTPFKYAEIPQIYKKPLKIVCVAYQEYELRNKNTPLIGDKVRETHRKILDFYKTFDIEIIGFSQLI
jgi:hypothetical protein